MKIVLKLLSYIALAVVLIALCLGVVIGFIILSELILAPDGYLFYEHGQFSGAIMIIWLMLPVILLSSFLIAKLKIATLKHIEEVEELVFFWNRLGKFRIAAVVVWVIGLYCCFANVTYVTDSEIIRHTPLNPAGTHYEYSDVEKIETGFGNKKIAFLEYKKRGSFYYKITLDSKDIIFHTPSVNGEIERYEEDSYLELEDFDSRLVALDIPKQASADGYEKCYFEKEFVDRFLRIINNTKEG